MAPMTQTTRTALIATESILDLFIRFSLPSHVIEKQLLQLYSRLSFNLPIQTKTVIRPYVNSRGFSHDAHHKPYSGTYCGSVKKRGHEPFECRDSIHPFHPNFHITFLGREFLGRQFYHQFKNKEPPRFDLDEFYHFLDTYFIITPSSNDDNEQIETTNPEENSDMEEDNKDENNQEEIEQSDGNDDCDGNDDMSETSWQGCDDREPSHTPTLSIEESDTSSSSSISTYMTNSIEKVEGEVDALIECTNAIQIELNSIQTIQSSLQQKSQRQQIALVLLFLFICLLHGFYMDTLFRVHDDVIYLGECIQSFLLLLWTRFIQSISFQLCPSIS